MLKYVLVSQFFPPDPTAVGQQAYDLAYHISKKKINIEVLTSNANYNNQKIKYPSQRINKNFFIRRIPFLNFGKKNFFDRIIGQTFFIIQCFFYLKISSQKNFTLILTTSPSISCALGFALHFLDKKLKIIYWVSDINPDQSIKLNIFKKTNILVKILMFFEKQLLKRSFKIITLDNYMRENLKKKIFSNNAKITVVPPWCHEESLKNIKSSKNYFINKYNLNNKFVIIYSGNHSIANPLITFFKAAKILKNIQKIQFIFIGEGNIKNELTKYKELNNVDLVELFYDYTAESITTNDILILTKRKIVPRRFISLLLYISKTNDEYNYIAKAVNEMTRYKEYDYNYENYIKIIEGVLTFVFQNSNMYYTKEFYNDLINGRLIKQEMIGGSGITDFISSLFNFDIGGL
jgi:glycosyltransferase involved in cell wall biosynthesis